MGPQVFVYETVEITDNKGEFPNRYWKRYQEGLASASKAESFRDHVYVSDDAISDSLALLTDLKERFIDTLPDQQCDFGHRFIDGACTKLETCNPGDPCPDNSSCEYPIFSELTGFCAPTEPPQQKNVNAIHYNDAVAISIQRTTYKTSNCGWYGCGVIRANDRAVSVGHGGVRAHGGPSRTTRFFIRTLDSGKWSKCVAYGDEAYLAVTKETYKTRNCGIFGCRVLQTKNPGGKELKLDHGTNAQPFMLLHPTRPAETKGDCVT